MSTENFIDLKELSVDIRDGYIHAKFHPKYKELMILNYSSKTCNEKSWTDLRRRSRGLVVNHLTGECINNPFPKFFNLSEEDLEEKYLDGSTSFSVENKLDGSLAIGFVYSNEMLWITKGANMECSREIQLLWDSLISHLRDNEKQDVLKALKGYTLLAEFESPDYRIVKPQSRNQLTLLGIRYNNNKQKEMKLVEASTFLSNLNIPMSINLGLDTRCMHMAEYKNIREVEQSILSLDRKGEFKEDFYEGVVIRYEDGKRIKIKTPTYVENHALVNNATPKNTVKLWGEKGGEELKEMFSRLPEEVVELHEEYLEELETIETHLIQIADTVNSLYENFKDIVSFGDFAKRLDSISEELVGLCERAETIKPYKTLVKAIFFSQKNNKSFELRKSITRIKLKLLKL